MNEKDVTDPIYKEVCGFEGGSTSVIGRPFSSKGTSNKKNTADIVVCVASFVQGTCCDQNVDASEYPCFVACDFLSRDALVWHIGVQRSSRSGFVQQTTKDETLMYLHVEERGDIVVVISLPIGRRRKEYCREHLQV